MKRLILIFLFIPSIGWIAGCGVMKKERAPIPTSNASVEARIRNKLKTDPLTAPWEINPTVEGNTVTLTGLVDREEERRRAEELTRSVVGELRKVNDQIMLTQEVILDNSITGKLKTELITNPVTRLTNIDVQSHKGVVTLNGSVKTNEQKREAERLAQETAGVVDVKNNLKVSG